MLRLNQVGLSQQLCHRRAQHSIAFCSLPGYSKLSRPPRNKIIWQGFANPRLLSDGKDGKKIDAFLACTWYSLTRYRNTSKYETSRVNFGPVIRTMRKQHEEETGQPGSSSKQVVARRKHQNSVREQARHASTRERRTTRGSRRNL